MGDIIMSTLDMMNAIFSNQRLEIEEHDISSTKWVSEGLKDEVNKWNLSSYYKGVYNKKSILITAPTGSGKSTFALKELPKYLDVMFQFHNEADEGVLTPAKPTAIPALASGSVLVLSNRSALNMQQKDILFKSIKMPAVSSNSLNDIEVNIPKTLYAHWAKNAAVTFRIVNGTWSGGAAEDKTVTVVLYPQADGTASGTLDASYVPQIMLPAPGYENTAGGWEQTPNTDPNGITGDVTYVYRFGSTGGGSSSGHSTRFTLHYESNGGTVYKDERYSSGTKVTLDKTPTRESYTFTGWYADKALTDKITNVKMTGNKTVYAGWTATNVPDMLNGDDHYAYVVGYSDGTVRPNANISRAEVATIFFRLLKEEVRDGNLTTENTFADVTDGQWHNKAISTMAKLGAVKGRNAEAFDPDAPITRAEFATICARFDKTQISTSSNFTDISGHWAGKYIERAATLGWIAGYSDGTFRPSNYITRAEAMTMINRVLCRMPETESNLLPGMITWPDNQPGTWYYLAVQEATNSHDYDRKDAIHEKWTALTEAPDWKYDLAQ